MAKQERPVLYPAVSVSLQEREEGALVRQRHLIAVLVHVPSVPFPRLKEELGPLAERHRALVRVLELVRVERWLPGLRGQWHSVISL